MDEEYDEIEEEVMPEWLYVLLRTRFWEACRRGHTKENRAEDCIFCLQCYQVFCPHCTHDLPGHRLLKIRRYVYRSVVLVKDMQELNVDVSKIQPYIINGQKGVHVRPMRRSSMFRPSGGAPSCKTCGCWLRTTPNLFCSITCKEQADVSQDDFSGPEAERRYRNSQPQMIQPGDVGRQHQPAEPEPRAEAEASSAVNTRERPKEKKFSYRTRPRKQEKPQRAPFF